jgi:transcriptional regulator with XRE-family HTH domain
MPTLSERELQALASAARELRAREQLRQEEVAEAGGLGRKYVGQLERAELRPSFAALVALARGLGVPVSEIVLLYEERLAG